LQYQAVRCPFCGTVNLVKAQAREFTCKCGQRYVRASMSSASLRVVVRQALPQQVAVSGDGEVRRIIFEEQRIDVGALECCKSASRYLEVTWDPRETEIVGAKLRGYVWTDTGFPGASIKIYFNETPVWDRVITAGDGHVEVDASVMVRRGTNDVRVEVCKAVACVPWWWFKSWVTLELVISYSGRRPVVEPPEKRTRFPLKEYITNSVVGAFIGAPILAGYAMFTNKPVKKHAIMGALLGAGAGIAVTYLTVGTEVEA